MNSVEQQNHKPTPKLVLDLTNKYKYMMQYRMFKFYINMGMKITKIHSVYRFKQSLWLGGYIGHNTQQRAKQKHPLKKIILNY